MKRRERKEHSAGAIAASSGVGATTALAGQGIVADHIRDTANAKRVKKSKTFNKFMSQLQPGDIIFSRSNHNDHRWKVRYLKKLLQLGAGNRHYHAAVFVGKGRVAEHAGDGLSYRPNAREVLGRGVDLVAYRPDVNAATRAKGLKRLRQIDKLPYMSDAGIRKIGIGQLVGIRARVLPKAGEKLTAVNCMTFPQMAYKEVFGDHYKSIAEIKRHPGVKLIARLDRTAETLADKATYRVGYNVAKNLKWGAIAAATAYGATRFAQSYANRQKAAPPAQAQKAPVPLAKVQATPNPVAKPKGAVRFIRVRGRIIPIRAKGKV